MKNRLILLSLLALLLVVACGESEPTANTPSEDSPTAVIAEQTTDEVTSSATSAAQDVAPAGAYAFATTVEEAAVIRAEDHYLGSDTPAVTIIEYGDFQ